MPRVPTYGDQRVGQAADPGVRRTAFASPDAYGATTGRALQQVGGTLGSIGNDIAARERQKADQVAIQEAERKLAQWENARLYDPQTGALNRKGSAAFPELDAALSEYDGLVSEIQGQLNGDRQTLAFREAAAGRRLSVERTLQRHVTVERSRFDQESTASFIEAERRRAAANPTDETQYQESWLRQVNAWNAYADRNGVDPETKQNREQEIRSALATSVLDARVAGENYEGLDDWLKANRDEFTPEALTRAKKVVEAETTRGRSVQVAEDLVAQHDTQSAALEALRELQRANPDSPVWDQARQRVKSIFSDRQAAKAADEQEAFQELSSLRAGGEVGDYEAARTFLGAKWQDVSEDFRKAVKNLYGADGTQTNPLVYARVRNDMEQKPQEFAALTPAEVWATYGDGLSRGDMLRILDAHAEMNARKADPKAFTPILDAGERILRQAQSFGMVPRNGTRASWSTWEAGRFLRLETAVTRDIESQQAATGKRLTGEQIDETIARHAIRLAADPSFELDLGDLDAAGQEALRLPLPPGLTDAEAQDIRTAAREFFAGGADYDAIPERDRDQYRNLLRSNLVPLDEDRVLAMHMAALSGDFARFQVLAAGGE